MGVFAYRALDARQRPRAGTITADTAALARQLLRAQGLFVAAIGAARPPGSFSLRGMFRRSRTGGARKRAQVCELWRNLAVLLTAGVPLADALDVCRRQQRGSIEALLRHVHESVRGGEGLAAALARHNSWFDPLALAIVQVGEQSGALADALRELADYEQRRSGIVNQFSTALIYPLILCLVGTGVVIFLMSHVVPQLLEVLSAAGRELPAPTRILKALSDGLIGHAWLIAIGLVGLAGLLAAAWRSPRGRRMYEQATLAVPVLGDLVRKVWLARISMMLATLLRSDVRFTQALRTVRQALPHRLYAEQLQALEQAVEAGAGLAEPLAGSRLIPPLVAHVLTVGQESGELPAMLAQLRDAYEQEVRVALARFLAVLEPALILVLALVIGFVVFATLLPILETTRIVGT